VTFLTRIHDLFRLHRSQLDPAASAAVASAQSSRRQADEDLTRANRKLAESQQVVEILRGHNMANHYDRLLEEIVSRQVRGARRP
jgi:hypothetical protein